MMIAFVVSAYLMQAMFVIGLFAGESFAWASYVGLGLALVTFAFGVIVVTKSLTGAAEERVSETMIIKLMLIPYYIINFIIGVMLAMGALINIMVFPIIMVVIITIFTFTYFMVVVTSMPNARYLVKKVWKEPDGMLVFHIVLHFLFITDVISSVVLYEQTKKREEVKE
ncbi:MAG: DUF6652 family protein [Bacilli bacterium]|jgi:hypothetical protein